MADRVGVVREDIADDLRYIAAHENDPRKEDVIYEAADAIAELEQQRLMVLAAVYGEAPKFVATICDTKLDPSGKLLGKVRDLYAAAIEASPNPDHQSDRRRG